MAPAGGYRAARRRSLLPPAVGRTLIVLAILVGVGAVVWILPALLTRPASAEMSVAERLQAENDVRTTLLQGLGALGLLGGLFFTARTLRLNQQGQVTDRYTKAVEQLGRVESEDVRIGAVYALERIARDSSSDAATIVES